MFRPRESLSVTKRLFVLCYVNAQQCTCSVQRRSMSLYHIITFPLQIYGKLDGPSHFHCVLQVVHGWLHVMVWNPTGNNAALTSSHCLATTGSTSPEIPCYKSVTILGPRVMSVSYYFGTYSAMWNRNSWSAVQQWHHPGHNLWFYYYTIVDSLSSCQVATDSLQLWRETPGQQVADPRGNGGMTKGKCQTGALQRWPTQHSKTIGICCSLPTQYSKTSEYCTNHM